MSRTDHNLEMAHSIANDAVRAVAMQHYRVGQPLPEDERFFARKGFRQETDVRFLIVALRWLREGCRLAADVTRDRDLHRALSEFDAALPDTKDMRDVGEHVAEYFKGRGWLQQPQVRATDASRGAERRGEHRSLAVRIWRSQDDASTTFTWAGMETNLDTASTRPSANPSTGGSRADARRCVGAYSKPARAREPGAAFGSTELGAGVESCASVRDLA
jgi:hypothetical protein